MKLTRFVVFLIKLNLKHVHCSYLRIFLHFYVEVENQSQADDLKHEFCPYATNADSCRGGGRGRPKLSETQQVSNTVKQCWFTLRFK